MGTWGTILFIIIAFWGVISQVLEAAARKAKEKKRQEELARQASRELDVTVAQPEGVGTSFEMRSELPGQAEPGQTPRSAPVGVATQQPRSRQTFAQRPRQRGEDGDLAARRREQLEQLRQRRALGDLRGTIGTARGGPAQGTPIPPAQRRPTQPTMPTRRVGRQPQPPQRQQPPQPPVPAPRPAKPKTLSYRSGRPLDAPMESVRAPVSRHSIEEITAGAQSARVVRDAYSMPTLSLGLGGPGTQPDGDGGAARAALQKLLSEPHSLRQVFLAKELLDAPVSLRSDPEHGYLTG